MGARPVIFKSRNGLKLHGMLHLPDGQTRKTGIIILSPGIKSRVAPHRLYVKMSALFEGLGFAVFRFDPEGMGDSEGEVNEKQAADVYGSIQVGRFVDNTISAMDWMQSELGIKKFILSGLCGGAITGLLAGARDSRVDSLLGLGIPVILDGSNVDKTRFMTTGQLGAVRKGYFRKALDPKAWLRLLSFKSDYRLIFRSLWSSAAKKKSQGEQAGPPEEKKEQGNFNSLFPAAFRQMAGSRKLCLIFSESDRLYWEFQEKFSSAYKEEMDRYGRNVEIHVTPEANHVFTFRKWQDGAFGTMRKWLEDNYGKGQ